MRYVRSFGFGLVLAAVLFVVASLFGAAETVWVWDVSLAGLGLVIAGAVALGIPLGSPPSIRRLDEYGETPPAPGAAARLALGSLGLYAGAMVSALVAG